MRPPGTIPLETVPRSSLPDELRGRGFDVRVIGEGERILPRSIIVRFTRAADGLLEALTEGSTKPVSEVRTHAGIAEVRRYGFVLR